MADRWFRLDEKRDDTVEEEAYRPDFKGHYDDIDGYSSKKAHPDGAPHVIVRVFADEDVLESLASEPGVKKLGDVPVDVLNQIASTERDKDGWKRGFRIRKWSN